MEDWDQEMLEKVVQSKGQEYNKNKLTDRVCKYFLEAVEKKQYGWFWVCPNGGKDCHYRHALPPGYVLKSQMKALIEEEADKIPIEEEIENQRAKITATTPMTPELFMQWKKKKVEEREAGLAAQRAERAKNDCMSGRELFLSDASLFVDDAEAYDKYRREEEPDAEQKVFQLHTCFFAQCKRSHQPR
ncbi:zinc finger CCCH domain-containing protein 11-like isoform X3 [Olea europaea var. sylvestris]|uniref:zinc finger CCCH domain-containing protein 11-like isoform X3 n=1 Tax=Olea europaea var. sylvestris TaxID=158386 RepID=UPI000C1D76A0|nr:zinc finger CCCH domain-containing protein 11-like isoform X3 [Olea europaea var. sylvestris]